MRFFLLLLLLTPLLRGAIYRVAFVGRIDEVYLSGSYAEELEAGSLITGSILIDSEAPDIQPTIRSYGGYQIEHSEILIGARRFSIPHGSCLLYDNFVFSNLRQDRVVIGAFLNAYGPQKDGSLVLRFDELPLDTLDSVNLGAALAKLSQLPSPRLVIDNSYTSPYPPYARGSLTVLKVDIVPESALSLVALDAERRALSYYRPGPGSALLLQRSLDLVEWSDLVQIPADGASFQWLDTSASERVFYRVR